ncbi:MAG TPA: ABC transporter permease [Burkholderiaceae bacterium]|nr:ABC transporter permease [Burkholderiaceae bacterium]
MSTWRLLVAYLRSRPLMTLLTAVLIALATATMSVVTQVTSQFEHRLEQDAAGIDLVVGPKGSPLQLALAAVYHADVPPGNIPARALADLAADRMVAQAIPIALGDSFRGYRIVGTTPQYPANYNASVAIGRMFAQPMEAVLGARVAAATGVAIGGNFVGTHGLREGGPTHGDDVYRVVGVLAPTGTVIDRLVLTPVESVWLVHEGEPADDEERRLLEAERELSAILLRYASPLAAATLPRRINASTNLQAASPATEAARLFHLIGIGADAVRAFGVLLVVAAALSVFVALFQALADRRYELALMRMLGASPRRLFALLVLEGTLLTAAGVAAGLLAGHLTLSVLGAWFVPGGEFDLGGWRFDTIELQYAGVILLLGALAAVVPALLAARTPISVVLAEQ